MQTTHSPTSPQQEEEVLLIQDKGNKKKQTVLVVALLFLGTVILGAGILSLSLIDYLLFPREFPSILLNYHVSSRVEKRPLIWENAMKEAQIISLDGGSSNQLPDGSFLWLFGETTLENGLIPNSAMKITIENGNWTSAEFIKKDQMASQVIPNQQNQHPFRYRLWVTILYYLLIEKPGASVLGTDKMYLYWSVIGPGWKEVGVGIGYFNSNVKEFSRLKDDIQGSLVPTASVIGRDNMYRYFYMMKQDTIPGYRLPIVARQKVETLGETPDQYEFWNGQNWVKEYEDAKPIFAPEAALHQISVEFNSFLDHYVMLIPSGSVIKMRTSKEAWGTWSDPVDVFEVPEDELGDGGFVYSAYFHKELWSDEGRKMLFTYNIGGILNTEEKPHLAAVELK